MGLALLILFVASVAIAVLLGVYGLGTLLGRWDRRRRFDAPMISAPVPRPTLRPPPRRDPVPAAVTPPPPIGAREPERAGNPIVVMPPAPPLPPRFQPARPGVIATPPPVPPPSRLARGSMPPVEVHEEDTPPLVPSRTAGARFSIVRSTRR